MEVKGFKDTIKWYDENAERYSRAIEDYGQQGEIDEFALLLPKGAKVLDAGCAAGRDSRLLSKKGLNVTGIDLSVGLIEAARRGNPNLEFVQGDFLNLPFSDSCFDGIWAHASLLHLETVDDVKKALSEFSRVLKRSGVIHVLVKAQTDEKKFVVVSDTLSEHDRFFQFFKEKEIRDLLNQAGFETEKIEQYKEIDKNPKGRPEVEWILYLGKKK